MIILDTNSIAAKSFFATHYNSDRYDEKLFGSAFLNSFFKIITDLTQFGNELLLCLDSRCWRHDYYPKYKQNRNKLKEETFYQEYKESFHDMVAEMATCMPVRVVKRKGYEADDLIAYYCKKFSSSIIVSNDKDMKQLIDLPKVQFYNFDKQSMVRIKDKKFFLHKLICLGDVADNIPKIIPRGKDGKYIFQFGEKTIEKTYETYKNTFIPIKGEFLEKMRDTKGMTDKILSEIVRNYEGNKKLIDLSLSPVHEEKFQLDFSIKYDAKQTSRFLYRYLGSRYENQVERIDEIMRHYFVE